MKLKTITLMFLTLIVSACASIAQAPQNVANQVTAVANTAVAAQTMVSVAFNGTPIASATTEPAERVELCIPPIGWQTLTSITLKSGEKVTSTNGWVQWFGTDGKMKGAVQAQAEATTPFDGQGLSIKVVICNQVISYDPDSVK